MSPFSPPGKVLVATAGLSHFVTARYAPEDAWRGLWAGVLHWLVPNGTFPELKWTPTVRPSFGPDEALPVDVERTAVRRALAWYRHSKLIPPESRRAELEKSPGKLPVPPPNSPDGDGSLGICEAIMAGIRSDGSQWQGTSRRGDCNGKSAAALALSAKALGDSRAARVSGNILNYWYNKSGAGRGMGRPEPRRLWADRVEPRFARQLWRRQCPAAAGHAGRRGSRRTRTATTAQ